MTSPIPIQFTNFVTSNFPIGLLQCPKCPGVFSEQCHEVQTFPDICCLQLSCGNHGCLNGKRSWYLCVDCKKRFPKRAKMEAHYRHCHPPVASIGVTSTKRNLSSAFTEEEEDEEEDVPAPAPHNNMETPSSTIRSPYPSRPITKTFSWISKLHDNVQVANIIDVMQSLRGLDKMQDFWSAEHATPGEDKVGAGIQFLVGKALHGSKFIPKQSPLPSFPEARWHFINFIQYMSMNQKQRQRQAALSLPLLDAGEDSFFQTTRIPNLDDLHRLYGTSSHSSIWNSLPIPVVHSIGDIAYVNPVDTCRYIFANGLDIDNIAVSHDCPNQQTEGGKIFYVSESAAVKEIIDDVAASAQRFPVIICWCSDWRDGFGAHHVKNLRNSVVAWTWSCSPTKEKVNTTDNTFPVALGLKKSTYWSQVEHRFRQDMMALSNSSKPIQVYHGGLRKMVHVCFRHIASLEDKVERAEVTHTMSHSSDYHRLFGTIVRLQYAPIKTDIKGFLTAQTSGFADKTLSWGWSYPFVLSGQSNGGKLPSCRSCRQRVLSTLLGVEGGDLTGGAPAPSCVSCADWKICASTSDLLKMPAGSDYPAQSADNCPVAPPAGRETGLKWLAPMQLSFPFLKQATKFAFSNIIAPQASQRWKKSTFSFYLRTCAVNKDIQDELWQYAQTVRQEALQNTISFDGDVGFGSFLFPASWNGELPPQAYIETVMHLLYLGVAKWNFELCDLWIKEFSTTKSGGGTGFRRGSNELLLFLNKFQLSWLMTRPFGADGGYGSWVSENWAAWTRISKVVYGCCYKDGIESERTGGYDVARMVVSYHALVARVMSHHGTDAGMVARIDALIREFMSCVRELDIRMRHNEMSEKKVPNSSRTNRQPHVSSGSAKSSINDITRGAFFPNQKLLADSELFVKSLFEFKYLEKYKDHPPILIEGRVVDIPQPSNDYHFKIEWVPSQTQGVDPLWLVDSFPGTDGCRVDHLRRAIARFVAAKPRGEEHSPPNSNPPVNASSTTKRRAESTPPTLGQQRGATTTSKKKRAAPPKPTQAWWMKSNYISLFNLVPAILLLGPLINFYDGGGKGEKFIQEVKPLVPSGLREGFVQFFVSIIEKILKYRQIFYFENFLGLQAQLMSLLDEIEREWYDYYMDSDGNMKSTDPLEQDAQEEANDDHHSELRDSDDSDDDQPIPGDEEQYTQMEDRHMRKTRTIYVYRKLELFEASVQQQKPLAGIVVAESDDNGRRSLQFYTVYRKPQRMFGWSRIVFDDPFGCRLGGVWYAPIKEVISLQEDPQSYDAIQSVAKMSAVAIPMSYAVGPDTPHSNSYCIITNWWKERDPHGRYILPELDGSLYNKPQADSQQPLTSDYFQEEEKEMEDMTNVI